MQLATPTIFLLYQLYYYIQVDFETFLTMSEEDLKEVGVATLGARRKLQIAIAG